MIDTNPSFVSLFTIVIATQDRLSLPLIFFPDPRSLKPISHREEFLRWEAVRGSERLSAQ